MIDPLALLSVPNLAVLLATMNFIAFAAFGLDKEKAEKGERRISEASLLQLAFMGGIIGAYAGRAAFRHKTRKQPFSSNLHAIAIFQAFALALGLGWVLAG